MVFHIFRIVLFGGKFRQIFKLAQKMDQAYLMVKKVKCKISAVSVRDGYHVFQGFAEFVLKNF